MTPRYGWEFFQWQVSWNKIHSRIEVWRLRDFHRKWLLRSCVSPKLTVLTPENMTSQRKTSSSSPIPFFQVFSLAVRFREFTLLCLFFSKPRQLMTSPCYFFCDFPTKINHVHVHKESLGWCPPFERRQTLNSSARSIGKVGSTDQTAMPGVETNDVFWLLPGNRPGPGRMLLADLFDAGKCCVCGNCSLLMAFFWSAAKT